MARSRRVGLVSVLFAASLLLGVSARAATFTWSASATEESPYWSNPAAWTVVSGTDADGVPDGDDVVIFDATSAVGATLDRDFSVSQLTVASTYGGVVRFSSGARLTTTTTSSTVNALKVEGADKLEALGGIVRVSGGIIDSLAGLGTLELAAATTINVMLARDLDVFGPLIVTSMRGILPVSGTPRVRVHGDVTCNHSDLSSTVVISLVGSGDQIVTGPGKIKQLDVTKPSGDVLLPTPFKIGNNFTGDTQARIKGELVFSGGVVANYRGTLETLRIADDSTLSLSWSLRMIDLVIESVSTVTASGDQQLEVLGDVIANDANINASHPPVSFVASSGDQHLGGTGRLGTIEVAKAAGKVILTTERFPIVDTLLGNAQAHIVGTLQLGAGSSSVVASYDGFVDALRVDTTGYLQLGKSLRVGELVIANINRLNNQFSPQRLLKVDGDVTISDADFDGTSWISLTGTGNQHVGGAAAKIPKLDISKPSGEVTIASHLLTKFATLAVAYADANNPGPSASVTWSMRGISVAALNKIIVYNRGVLGGNFTLTGPATGVALEVQAGGRIAPDSTLTINGNLALLSGASLAIDGLSGVPGTTSDKVIVNGTVSVSGATLTGTSGGPPSRRVVFLENDGTDLVTTRFSGASSNPSSVTIDGQSYFLHYTAGDGNDLAVYPPDGDNDGIGNAVDNCPTSANVDQADADNDAQGDACDPDDDNDGTPDATDNCPVGANPDQLDTDHDLAGDICDLDDDGDGVLDIGDLCPLTPGGVHDADGDGCPDEVTAIDTDLDGLPDDRDNCPDVANADQLDTDLDLLGDACDDDDDNDGVADGRVRVTKGSQLLVDLTLSPNTGNAVASLTSAAPSYEGPLAPGTYRLSYYAHVATFTITTDGKIAYDTLLEGVFTGAGTSLLTVQGARVMIDARAAADVFATWTSGYGTHGATSRSSDASSYLYVLPGPEEVRPYYAHTIPFSVTANGTPDGTISYDPTRETFLDGAGTSTLKIDALTIQPALRDARGVRHRQRRAPQRARGAAPLARRSWHHPPRRRRLDRDARRARLACADLLPHVARQLPLERGPRLHPHPGDLHLPGHELDLQLQPRRRRHPQRHQRARGRAPRRPRDRPEQALRRRAAR